MTAGGKNVAPAVLEDRLRAHPLVSQCMVVGDRQPFIAALVTIDEEALPDWLADARPPRHRPSPTSRRRGPARRGPDARSTRPTGRSPRPRRSRCSGSCPHDFTEATGELTPSLKVKRSIVQKDYADEIADIYRG